MVARADVLVRTRVDVDAPAVAQVAVVSAARLRAAVVVVVVAAVDRVPKAPSDVRGARRSAGVSRRSSVVKNSTRWKRPRLVACASAKVMDRLSACVAARR